MRRKSVNQAEGRSSANPRKVIHLADKKTLAISADLHREMLETVHTATGVYPQIQDFVEDAIRAKLKPYKESAESKQLKKASGQ